jgi:rRNA maturation endonuclease Nob1
MISSSQDSSNLRRLEFKGREDIIFFMKVKCEACGTEYEDPASSICDNCGMRMNRIRPQKSDETPENVRCLKCGARYSYGVKICSNCGDLIRY